MSTEDNKHISRRFLEELWNEQNRYIIDELIADNYVDHTTTPYIDDGELQGPETFKKVAAAIQKAFFLIHVTIRDQIAEDDQVATHAIWECTLRREDDPTAAGRVITLRNIGIDRIDHGLIVENWNTLEVLYRLISLFNLADPFTDPDMPKPGPPKCDPNNPKNTCGFGRTCLKNGTCGKP